MGKHIALLNVKGNVMATRGRLPCRHRGCIVLLATPGYCAEHEVQHRKASDAKRGSASERGYGRRWQKARATHLSHSPLCVECEREGRPVPATDVDHKVPHRMAEAQATGDAEAIRRASSLFWDTSNWQSLCKRHHSEKTAREDGGFGNKGAGSISAAPWL